MKIADINIGTRYRKDLGDIAALAASIKAIGLLHPIVVNTDGLLIVGERRLMACKTLGWTDIPATVSAEFDVVAQSLVAERDENTCRLDPPISAGVELGRQLELLEKRAAAARKSCSNGERVKLTPSEKGAAADKVAEAVGMSRPTLEKAKAVVEAARNHPEHYEDIREEMDTTGKVAPAYAKLAERQEQPEKPKVRLPHKTAPTWEWSKAIQTIFETLSIVKKRGGIVAVVKEWDRDEREDYLRVMKHVRDQFGEYIPIVEKELA